MTKENRRRVTTAAARALVSMLTRLGYPCALSGEIACYAYCCDVPKKVEALILTPTPTSRPSIEALKTLIARESHGPSFFYLSQSHTKPFTLIYYHDPIEGEKKRTCDIELDYLDTFNETSLRLIQHVDGLPIAPLSYVLLKKLEQWEEATVKLRTRLRKDIDLLLAFSKSVTIDNTPLNPNLHESSRKRVDAYAAEFPAFLEAWKNLGFVINPPNPKPPILPRALVSSLFMEPPIGSPIVIENPTRIQILLLAAKTAIDIIHTLGLSCALYGSLGCFLYGNTRAPNDVDLLALPLPGHFFTTEYLKASLVRADPAHFYLIPSRNPTANYKVLYYQFDAAHNHHSYNRRWDAPADSDSDPLTSCKVDIVFPGTLNLPQLPLTKIVWDEGLPLIPFSLLLLQKLQGWDDHRKAEEEFKRLKQRTDVEDVKGLLGLSEVLTLRLDRPWSDRRVFGLEFEKLSRRRVVDFCEAFPECMEDWMQLGFYVVRPSF